MVQEQDVLAQVSSALGDDFTVAGVSVTPRQDGSFEADPAQADVRPEFRDFLRGARRFRFDARTERGVTPLARNHPLVEQLAPFEQPGSSVSPTDRGRYDHG